MNEPESLITWWREERKLIRNHLIEKAKIQALSDVESMILNPFSLEEARKQVADLNGFVDSANKKSD